MATRPPRAVPHGAAHGLRLSSRHGGPGLVVGYFATTADATGTLTVTDVNADTHRWSGEFSFTGAGLDGTTAEISGQLSDGTFK